MFNLNDAPNTVLAAISAHKKSRQTNKILSFFFCLPTLGASFGNLCCDEEASGIGCYPKKINLNTKTLLKGLVDFLEGLIYPADTRATKEIISWQVTSTISGLTQILNNDKISQEYVSLLVDLKEQIQLQSRQDATLAPLLEAKPSLPSHALPSTPSLSAPPPAYKP